MFPLKLTRPRPNRRLCPAMGSVCSRKGGFTLIELLVVISIIAVLAGLLLPVFNSIQADSRRVKCTSNLRQIGSAILLYAGENQMNLPGDKVPWDQSVAPYFGYTSTTFKTPAPILTCPSDLRKQPLADGNYPRSYSVSAIKAENSTQGLFSTSSTAPSRNLSTINSTANKIMVFEYYTNNSGTAIANEQFQGAFDWADGFQNATGIPRVANGSSFAYYHGATMNFCFADGHVASLDPTTVYNPNKVLW
jgi:prepilin-type N-terminal cleavage/methylation domain-containing protein/prepilin-type processing-associated H-X9-DG protein